MQGRDVPSRQRRGWARRSVALVVAATALAPAVATAQDRTFYLDRLRIGGAPEDGLGVWRPEMGKQTRIFGQLGMGFSLNPLRTDNYVDDERLEEQLAGNPVDRQLITYFSAGAEFFDRVAIQASFPLIVNQAGAVTGEGADGRPVPGIREAVGPAPVAPMDLRLDARVIVFRTPDRAFKLAVTGAVFVPTGNEVEYGGDINVAGSLGLAAEYDFRKFFVTVNVGGAIRPPAQLHEFNVGSELTYGAAAYVPLLDDRLRVGAEIFGSFGLRSSTFGELDASPIEWMAAGKYFFTQKKQVFVGAGAGTRLSGGYAPDFRGLLVVGGAFNIADVETRAPDFRFVIEKEKDTDGDGYPDVIDLCPEDKEDGKAPKPSDGCPDMPDRDGDGIPDVVDLCPDEPEDMDGIDDRDGCPETDADQDGVPDAEDKCPKEPGQPVAEDPSKNGCPYYIRRITGSAEIQILKQVEFQFDSWTILPRSFPILDEVVRLFKANPEIKLVSIEGHTDNQGTVEYNQKLADSRANAVRLYLINRGVERQRLTSKGFGSTRPLDSNDTEQGRQRNRRVEFHIISQSIEGR
ncbi:OmpA family protein [Chondromyces crocatus]|uniref:Cell envelope biogenesis protein OmpA n=1 Tax=Chondromyces crocatus TaxID=52 RepID=A0A0K1EGE8_CHOCO|nr:OmpA family protein [Chondromyces crocatus]AKT39757.1 cell envelope biogenesis protein OmpA [Chondromyces crocatus]